MESSKYIMSILQLNLALFYFWKLLCTDLNVLCLLGEYGGDPPDPPGPDPEGYQAVQPDHADGGKCD